MLRDQRFYDKEENLKKICIFLNVDVALDRVELEKHIKSDDGPK